MTLEHSDCKITYMYTIILIYPFIRLEQEVLNLSNKDKVKLQIKYYAVIIFCHDFATLDATCRKRC